MRGHIWWVISLIATMLLGCGQAAGTTAARQSAAAPATTPTRAMVMAVRYEVVGLAAKRLEAAAWEWTKRPFNASLALIDGNGASQPYLAESLPQLDTDSWKVSPDGRMETTYRLRPNLTWHDGAPLTADDFVFAAEVYQAKGLGAFTSSPQDKVDAVVAADPRTLVIRWKDLYGEAGALTETMLDPLPKHILESSLASYQQDPSTADAFLSSPFWTTQYVGLGPYRLADWQQGVQFEGAAFDGHALGRPKIDRIVIRIIQDENTVVSSVVAGNVDIAGDRAIRPEHAQEIQRQLGPNAVGLIYPAGRHYLGIQFRPELQKTPGLLDLRVRRALAHAMDRDAINQAMYDGQGAMGDQWVPPGLPYSDDVERSVTHYPFDPRQSQALMQEAGFTRDASGFFASATGERFRPQLMVDGSNLFEREMSTIQDIWAKIGIDVEPKLLPAAESRILAARTTFPGIYGISTGIRENQLDIFSSADIATEARGWAGNNRVGWSNPDYDQAWNAFNSLLDRGQRNEQIVKMMKVATDQLPAIMVHFNPGAIAFRGALHGPEAPGAETWPNWNIQDWTLS
ncbi:MAG TPA: ABC transporter substrate-binding protein [Chloroflexota bacterium]|nr:ABC transporter substrate-binding protein [Chloroflexota bacterium]